MGARGAQGAADSVAEATDGKVTAEVGDADVRVRVRKALQAVEAGADVEVRTGHWRLQVRQGREAGGPWWARAVERVWAEPGEVAVESGAVPLVGSGVRCKAAVRVECATGDVGLTWQLVGSFLSGRHQKARLGQGSTRVAACFDVPARKLPSMGAKLSSRQGSSLEGDAGQVTVRLTSLDLELRSSGISWERRVAKGLLSLVQPCSSPKAA